MHTGTHARGLTVTVTVEAPLTFRVEVHDEVEKVVAGRPERFIVDLAQRLPRLKAKIQASRVCSSA